MKNVSSAKSAEAKAVVLSNVANNKNETAPLIVLPSLPTEKEETKEQVSAKVETPVQTSKKESSSVVAAPNKRLSIDELTDKAERVYLLRQKYQEVREKRKQLESFTISHDKNIFHLCSTLKIKLRFDFVPPSSVQRCRGILF